MARRCDFTGRTVLTGNNVSHSKRKTRRRFLPNMRQQAVVSDELGMVSLRIPVRTAKTFDSKGGFDAFLLSTPNRKLSVNAIAYKRRIRRSMSKKIDRATS